MAKKPPFPLLHFTDYRQLLEAWMGWRKGVDPLFTGRSLMRTAGFTGPNYLRELLDGKKNLSDEGASRLAAAMFPDGESQTHFCRLVRFNQATAARDKLDLLRELVLRQPAFEPARMALEQLELLADPGALALREALHAHPCNEKGVGELGEKLVPPLARRESTRAFRRLQELGLIQRDEQGCWGPTERIMATEPEVAGLAAHAYHRHKIGLALEALDRFAGKEREFLGVTGSFTDATWSQIRDEMRAFQHRILQLIDADPDDAPRRVHHLGLQLYPLERGPIHRRNRLPKGTRAAAASKENGHDQT